MHDSAIQEQPLRVGVFNDLKTADDVVARLLEAGFTQEQIGVVCSDKVAQEHFRPFHHQDPAGSHTKEAAVGGGVIGAALGGLAAVTAGVATGGVALLAAGGLALVTGGVVGGLVGAMMTRGFEKEAANFYDQAVSHGKILVAVEVHENDPALAMAERILAEGGAHPMPLVEG